MQAHVQIHKLYNAERKAPVKPQKYPTRNKSKPEIAHDILVALKETDVPELFGLFRGKIQAALQLSDECMEEIYSWDALICLLDPPTPYFRGVPISEPAGESAFFNGYTDCLYERRHPELASGHTEAKEETKTAERVEEKQRVEREAKEKHKKLIAGYIKKEEDSRVEREAKEKEEKQRLEKEKEAKEKQRVEKEAKEKEEKQRLEKEKEAKEKQRVEKEAKEKEEKQRL